MTSLSENPTVLRALNPPALRAGAHDTWQGLHGCAAALTLAGAANKHAGLTVAVVADEHRAYRLEDELRFFAPADLAVRHFPDW